MKKARVNNLVTVTLFLSDFPEISNYNSTNETYIKNF